MSTLITQAAEIGKTITDSPGVNLAGFTVNLLVQDTTGKVSSYPMAVNTVQNIASYVTLGSEFPIPGNYKAQLQLINAGEKFYTAVTSIKVIANLL
jgi:hypothetical protein